MTAYLLRDIDPKLWARFKRRAETDDVNLRQLLILLIAAYADGAIDVNPRTLTAKG